MCEPSDYINDDEPVCPNCDDAGCDYCGNMEPENPYRELDKRELREDADQPTEIDYPSQQERQDRNDGNDEPPADYPEWHMFGGHDLT